MKKNFDENIEKQMKENDKKQKSVTLKIETEQRKKSI